jgi:hypothetical protein
MAYGKMQDTWQYWELWNKKNRNVEKYFLAQWKQQMEEIRDICKNIEIKGDYIKAGRFDHDEPYYAIYVGTVFDMTPSGKYYLPFASSNVSVKEVAIDEFWDDELEKMLSEENCWSESGEGNPCDIFICKVAPRKRMEDLTDEIFDRLLKEIINENNTAEDLLAIPGIYEILSEYFNNEIIERYENE